jgi:muramoyltetrapeptide carboxypeptidase
MIRFATNKTHMLRPPFLKVGDKIGLVSPAKSINPKQVKPAVTVLQRWGLEPVFGRHLFTNYNQFAGNDKQRKDDVQEFLDDDSIRAILATRGGYGSSRIIDQLDFSAFNQKPKWFIGYSDITVFHSHIHKHFDIETLHATMPLNFPGDGTENKSIKSLKAALFGDLKHYKLENCHIFKGGAAIAPLVGGNLSILTHLIGSPSDINTNGKILVLEDVGENLYRIDRMVQQLKRAGKFKNLKALIIGSFNLMEDNDIPFGQTAEEIIYQAVKEYQYPVIASFPMGHEQDNLSLFLGRETELYAFNKQTLIKFL